MKGFLNKIRLLLWPFSLFYGLVTGIRNSLFKHNILTSYSFPLPVIGIGNITVGGTGKTPLAEYILTLLTVRKIAYLSRGYRRQSRGFLLATPGIRPVELGDEAFQVYSKFQGVTVAVDEKRAHGIFQLMKQVRGLEGIVLDDAFQHRYVRPGLNILVMDYNRPWYRDCLLPAGNLREAAGNSRRADVIVVNKCPEDLNRDQRDSILARLRPEARQAVYFSVITYGDLKPVFAGANENTTPEAFAGNGYACLLVTGIAHPAPLEAKIRMCFHSLSDHLAFADHHSFRQGDLRKIEERLNKLGEKSILITTEKDAVRIRSLKVSKTISDRFYYLPVSLGFLFEGKNHFDELILSYVGKNP